MDPLTKQWIIGLIFSSIGGAIFVPLFLFFLRKYMNNPKNVPDGKGSKGVPGLLTGLIERVFFTSVIGFNISGAPAAMLIWLTLKMATNWNSPFWDKTDIRNIRSAFASLLAGLVSMAFAVIGGVICNGTLSI